MDDVGRFHLKREGICGRSGGGGRTARVGGAEDRGRGSVGGHGNPRGGLAGKKEHATSR